MADIFDRDKRSEIMARVRSKNSKAELMAFSYLRKHGIYYQKHYPKAVGRPDIALPRKKIAVFIDGDFWHGRSLAKLKARPNGLNKYWIKKIEGNIQRDKSQRDELAAKGWKLLFIWESDILRKKTQDDSLRSIADFLRQ